MRTIRNIDDSSLSSVSLETVLRRRKDCTLRKAEPFFTDSTGYYFNVFWTKLEGLSGKTLEGPLCIEKLPGSERERLAQDGEPTCRELCVPQSPDKQRWPYQSTIY